MDLYTKVDENAASSGKAPADSDEAEFMDEDAGNSDSDANADDLTPF